MSSSADASVVNCTACRTRLVGADARREHYRSDLHRVNLKRKVAGLGPLSLEEFARRVETAREEAVVASRDREVRFCDVCSKKFSSARALENHRGSRRHRDAVRARERDGLLEDMEDAASVVGSDTEAETAMIEMDIERRLAEAVAVPPTRCVFDDHESATAEENVAYMAKRFGFFVPYIESLVDLEGLLTYIGQKVGIGYACVECDRAFVSVSSVQRHMLDKQHCRMTCDDSVWVEEYATFYDFGSSIEGEDEDNGYEEFDGEEMLAMEAEGLQLVDSSRIASAPVLPADDTLIEDVAMVVAGKKVIGHRSLRVYYNQKGRAVDERDAVVANKLLNEYRMMGWNGHGKLTPEVKAARHNAWKRMRFDMMVGRKNYYTRKAGLRPNMGVMNSGYRP